MLALEAAAFRTEGKEPRPNGAPQTGTARQQEQNEAAEAYPAPRPVPEGVRRECEDGRDTRVGWNAVSKSVRAQLQEAGAATSIRAAKELIRELLKKQVEQARAKGVVDGKEVENDAVVRRGMLFLLPDEAVRLLFLEFVQAKANLPRTTSLFGTPPYHFLRREDCSLLNSSAFSKSRSHMAYEDAVVCNYSQFGEAHFYDATGRQYKILFSKEKLYDENAPLPQNTRVWQSGIELDGVVRIPKRKRTEALLPFPGIGDELDIFFKVSTNEEDGKNARQQLLPVSRMVFAAKVRTRALRVRDNGARTALVRFVLLSKGESTE